MKHPLLKLLYRLGKRLGEMKYLNRKIVFGIDLFLSGFASLAIFAILHRVVPNLVVNVSVPVLLGSSLGVSALLLYLFGVYRIIIRHTTARDLMIFFYVAMLKSTLLGGLLVALDLNFTWAGILLLTLFDAALTVFLLLMFRSLLVSIYYLLIGRERQVNSKVSRVLIYGSDSESSELTSTLQAQSPSRFNPVGLVEVSNKRRHLKVHNRPVIQVANEEAFTQYVRLHQIDGVVFTSEEKLQEEENRMIEWCLALDLDMFVLPLIERTSGEVKKHIREVHIEDLLGRERISIELDKIKSVVTGKRVFVSGAAGSIGSEIARQLCKLNVDILVCYDNAETPLHNLELEIRKTYPTLNVEFILGDVRSSKRISATFERVRPEIVYHAAAYKHVPMIERNPCEAVLVNVLGTKNMVEMAVKYGVDRFVMISTDKAVRATNVMGATKRLAEMFAQSINFHTENTTRFITTRFGNVLGSNGSVIPLFREQIMRGGPVTVTHPDIVRYFMTIPEACRLVLQASAMGEGGEIFVFDMGEPVRIADLAKRMIRLAGLKIGKDIEIEYSGLRPGEKLYEELLTAQESTHETQHGKIRKAVVTPSDFILLEAEIAQLIVLSQQVKIDESVSLLKKLVPDYKSNNSRFEKLDA